MPTRCPDTARRLGAAPVLVVRVDDNPFHHGTLGAVRSLGRLGVPVFMTQRGGSIPASLSRYLQGTVIWPSGGGDLDALTDELLRLRLPVIGKPLLLPVDDAGAILLAERAEALRERYLLPGQSRTVPRTIADKEQLAAVCQRLGLPHPHGRRPPTWEALLEDVARQTTWPVVAKRVRPWTPPSVPGLKSTTIVHSAEVFRQLAERAGSADPGLLLQDFIPHWPGSQDWVVHGCYGKGATRVAAWSGVKDRSFPAHAGLTTLGRAIDNPDVLELADRVAAGVGFTGICDLDFRFDPTDGSYKLLDFNPRLGAQFRLFVDSAGLDVVRAYYLDTLGMRVATGRPPSHRSFLVENYDPVAALRYWRDGELSVREWLQSVREVRELAWFATDDPVPFAAMALRYVGRIASRRRERHAALPALDQKAVVHDLAS